ncbi:hypothetical protein [Loigolactobacillus backii]|uniref:hypothetical protein n=1 Tax=Loigolactobacillus backii TaxID=375175 RepID=UPI0022FD8553|nr:hypothetical protein [Loigolactobacillus backii]MDA5386501.1 hypothetical protein [Loigolactobacillus backii]MDA5389028.1 hypothetical protein [Loigolactobacillus backii]
MYEDVDYKLVPLKKYNIPMGYKTAKKKARELLSSAFIEAPNMNELADRIVDSVYRKEGEK